MRPFIIFPASGKWYHSTNVGNMMPHILPQKVLTIKFSFILLHPIQRVHIYQNSLVLNIQLPRRICQSRVGIGKPSVDTTDAVRYYGRSETIHYHSGMEKVVSRSAHNQEVAGSIPASATKLVELNLFDSNSFVKRCY